MIKNRSFVVGLGSGLIIGAVLLQLMLIGQGQVRVDTNQGEELMTKEQLEEQAAKLNLKVVSPDDEGRANAKDTQTAKGNEQTKQVEEPNKPASPDSPKSSQPVNNSAEQQSPKSPEAATKPVAPAPPKKENNVSYTIKSGSTLQDLASGLATAGVIKDKEAFLKQATSRKINSKIRAGSYSFVAGEKYSSIIQKVTTKPSR
ncbi:endolytic transglycosylase MltG [Paenibacillus sediminis]|uniref:Outer membrane biosynthesis protein TonB n=1 Tax=Paenibacillus sediminis TaxID=664909 RepID=A0ABS4H1K8_9BACL|nr:endolytic transglycosylase MltG [Paenibacillus sediminis]MBP1936395.1 outer membrane biosynthesis protein TonB [Paenibacillus sediminis]